MLLHMSATTLSIMTLIIITFSIITMNKMRHSAQPHSEYCRALLGSLAECQLCSMLCWVSHTSPLCWVSFCWMSLFWVSLCWMSWCLHMNNWKKYDAKILTLILTAYPNSLLSIEIIIQRGKALSDKMLALLYYALVN